MDNFLKQTRILNYNDPAIEKLVAKRGWNDLRLSLKIEQIYNFIRDEIKFGYNLKDNIKATDVLFDGYGQCNTKGILFMALLRAVGVPCRFHGFTINKELQKGAITGIWYKLAPKEIVHSWVEIYYEDRWINMEGFILDLQYLKSLQSKFDDSKNFCGFGVATKDLKKPDVFWNGGDTYIQKEGINKDYGVYDDPDSFFVKHKQNTGFFKDMIYRFFVRHLMNRNVNKIRCEKY